MLKRIVVGTDGSETAAEAVRHARELAKACGAALELVSAYRGDEAPDPASAYDPTVREGADAEGLPDDVARPVGERATVSQQLDAAAAAATREGIEEVTVHAREGEAAEVILTVAEQTGADLIVVGNKGMSGAKRFLLGSVPNKICHHAPCDVYVVRTT